METMSGFMLLTFLMRANECVDDVFIPTCQPQSDTTG